MSLIPRYLFCCAPRQDVQRTALRAIRNVAFEGVNKDTVCDFGGLPAIFAAMDTHLADAEYGAAACTPAVWGC